ncbi:MAG TPA: class 1 fructose-bisphosphatase [Nitrospirales bacterium]|nr:class 1 fructose-bisphosphatase [Nitrospirales bacterium]
MTDFPLTLTRHLLQEQATHPPATGEFSRLMSQLAIAGKLISRDLSRAGLINVLGTTGSVNVQGETIQKLDKIANETFVRAFEYDGALVKAIVSEEMDHPWELRDGTGGTGRTKYAVFLDPLDGSSNLDGNMTVGSIFSVHRVADGKDWQAGLLKPGTAQVAAGYLLYGPSTVMVYTVGQGVYQFTLDPAVGEFVLSASRVRMPERGKIYSVNEGNYHKWDRGVQRFVDYLRESDPSGKRPYSTRYSGCLVADVHRLLITGGLYMYPGELKKPEGKLRLMYEAAPLAFIIEQAGGKASTGTDRILDAHPKAVHQRVPLFIGSREEIGLVEDFIQRSAMAAAT